MSTELNYNESFIRDAIASRVSTVISDEVDRLAEEVTKSVKQKVYEKTAGLGLEIMKQIRVETYGRHRNRRC